MCSERCDEGPTNPEIPPTTTVQPEPPSRVDEPFSWDRLRGFTAFAVQPENVPALWREAMSHGFNTGRVCSETEFWDPGEGAYPARPRDVNRVKGILEAVAKIPGAQVILIGDCTLKRQVPLAESEAWAWTVAKTVQGWTCPFIGTCTPEEPVIPYQNVAIETHNEFANCRGRSDWGGRAEWCPGKQDVAAHIQIYRRQGIAEVTADDDICWGPDEAKTYEFRLYNVGARPADFHPCRTDEGGRPWDPDDKFLGRIAKFNGQFVLSETVAWTDLSGSCKGLSTCDKERIQSYLNRCAARPECGFVFHSRELLAGRPPTWWPEAR